MRNCASCGGELVRVRRTLREKFVYLTVQKCRKCGRREMMDQWFLFLFGRTSRCPRCGGYRVDKLRGVDHIDPMYKNPLSYMQKWFGANVHWCGACRLQFYDLRERVPYSKRMPRPVSAPADIADPSDAGS